MLSFIANGCKPVDPKNTLLYKATKYTFTKSFFFKEDASPAVTWSDVAQWTGAASYYHSAVNSTANGISTAGYYLKDATTIAGHFLVEQANTAYNKFIEEMSTMLTHQSDIADTSSAFEKPEITAQDLGLAALDVTIF